MKKVSNLYILIILFAFIASCARIRKSDAEVEREDWIRGFNDSIEYYQIKSHQLEDELAKLNVEINSALENFEFIKNPKEVSGYYLLQGWKNKIPMTTTGIYARINENEKLELIATLSGGIFDRIGVGTGKPEVYSETVPNDQAFNFRHERFNRVYFEGGKADTLAMYIDQHLKDKIYLEFLGGKKNRNFLIPGNQREMIALTYNLYTLQRQAKSLQKELWICSKKIETFRRIQDENNLNKTNI